MGLLDIFRKKEEESEILEFSEELEPREKISIRVENLTGTGDIDRFTKYLKEGNILFIKTKQLQKQDLGAFQMSVQKLKRVCQTYGFDLAGTEDGYLVVTPRFASIVRS